MADSFLLSGGVDAPDRAVPFVVARDCEGLMIDG